MPVAKEAPLDDAVNPGLRRKTVEAGLPKTADEESAQCKCELLRKGWFWACLISVVAVCIAAPLGHQAWVRANEIPGFGTETPKYTFNETGMGPVSTGYNPATGTVGQAGNYTPTCQDFQNELPLANIPKGNPPPALKIQGGKLVLANETSKQDVMLHGVNWPGFNTKKTMVDGLDIETNATWEGSDFATMVYQLRLLGFNAVRLPFQFEDLYQMSSVDYTRVCPEEPPTQVSLAARTTAPGGKVAPNKIAGVELLKPENYGMGLCNGYLPSGMTVLSRYLWVVQYLVASGFYVVMDYHPDRQGEPVIRSTSAFKNSWLRLWAAVTCLPDYKENLQGRVFLDLVNEPDFLGITWDTRGLPKGVSSQLPPLGEYYLSIMDAIEWYSPGEALFFIQGGGQSTLGIAYGDGFTTDATLIKGKGLADPSGFFRQLSGKSYKDCVVLAPHLYGPSVTKSPDVGSLQWRKHAGSWGHLQADGFCTEPKSCQKFPVVAGEIGSQLKEASDVQYKKDMATFMKGEPPTGKYKHVPFNSWFWWAYSNPSSKINSGLVGDDGRSIQWDRLMWLQKNLGLKPWYA